MTSVDVPVDRGQKYYRTHMYYVSAWMHAAGCSIHYVNNLPEEPGLFTVRINGDLVWINYTDHAVKHDCTPQFMFHCINSPNAWPLAPISFYDWSEYWRLCHETHSIFGFIASFFLRDAVRSFRTRNTLWQRSGYTWLFEIRSIANLRRATVPGNGRRG